MDLNSDINFEYHKMNNQIEVLEKINLDYNSLKHLNLLKNLLEKEEKI